LAFRKTAPLSQHFAMIGMAAVADGYPLYADAANEKGLCMAGLNFPDNAYYPDEYEPKKQNVSPFELIPWVLGQCRCLSEAKSLLQNTNVCSEAFSAEFPVTPLHWMISDNKCSIVVETLKDGIKIYDNPFEILTNNPPFDFHQTNVSNYMGLSIGHATSQFRQSIPMKNYSLGMGALGLPGDFSSASRFIRAFFVKENSASDDNEKSNVNQFFHILNSVAMPKGCVLAKDGFEYTRYSSCCNADNGIYYYTTYDNLEVTSIDMHDVDLNQSHLYTYDVKGLKSS
jgi:choloylglycine hydrolase